MAYKTPRAYIKDSPMKRMLINATQVEEIRVALVDGQKLFDLDIESGVKESIKSNIYRGIITRIEPSLEAAFVDYGADKHGFLPFKEISKEYYEKTNSEGKGNIKDLIKEGTQVTVQVDKEERGNKGAALTTFISLAGRYLVLMPNNGKTAGISRRVEGDDRGVLRESMKGLVMPNNMGVIARTAGVGRSSEELQWDLDYLIQVWRSIEGAIEEHKAPFLIYRESNLIVRAMRDYLRPDIGEVLIDEKNIYQETLDMVSRVMPNTPCKIKFYQDEAPLFSRFQVESQIETAFQREVKLPSGGTLVIDHTEALISIDINSARSIKGGDIEETALQTNLEAAEEIARQLRLRDLGGLIVIDFIDMAQAKNQREVEARMRDSLRIDRARVQVGKISKFGILEMSRQRLRASLGETSSVVCPRCKGQGTIRNVGSLSLSILRIIEEEAMKEKTEQVRAIVPLSVATFLSNEKRKSISDIEQRQAVSVLILGHADLDTPFFTVERFREDQLEEKGEEISYRIDLSKYKNENDLGIAPIVSTEEAAVKTIKPSVLQIEPKPKPSILARIKQALKNIFASENKPKNTGKNNQSKKNNGKKNNANSNAKNNGKNQNQNAKNQAKQKAAQASKNAQNRRKQNNANSNNNNNNNSNKNAQEDGKNQANNNQANNNSNSKNNSNQNNKNAGQNKSNANSNPNNNKNANKQNQQNQQNQQKQNNNAKTGDDNSKDAKNDSKNDNNKDAKNNNNANSANKNRSQVRNPRSRQKRQAQDQDANQDLNQTQELEIQTQDKQENQAQNTQGNKQQNNQQQDKAKNNASQVVDKAAKVDNSNQVAKADKEDKANKQEQAEKSTESKAQISIESVQKFDLNKIKDIEIKDLAVSHSNAKLIDLTILNEVALEVVADAESQMAGWEKVESYVFPEDEQKISVVEQTKQTQQTEQTQVASELQAKKGVEKDTEESAKPENNKEQVQEQAKVETKTDAEILQENAILEKNIVKDLEKFLETKQTEQTQAPFTFSQEVESVQAEKDLEVAENVKVVENTEIAETQTATKETETAETTQEQQEAKQTNGRAANDPRQARKTQA